MQVAKNRNQCRAIFNTVMNLQAFYTAENFLTAWATVSLSGKSLLHEVTHVIYNLLLLVARITQSLLFDNLTRITALPRFVPTHILYRNFVFHSNVTCFCNPWHHFEWKYGGSRKEEKHTARKNSSVYAIPDSLFSSPPTSGLSSHD
jgi:hypothetical protein